MMNFFCSRLSILAGLIPFLLVGCVTAGYPYNTGVPYGATPPGVSTIYYAQPVVIAPRVYPGYGYGYWYGGRFCGYRNGYYFRNGCYYRGNYHGYRNGYNRNAYNHNGNWQR